MVLGKILVLKVAPFVNESAVLSNEQFIDVNDI